MAYPPSIKQSIQMLQVRDVELLQGYVLSSNPLVIQLINDEKRELTGSAIIVPQRMTDYFMTIYIDGEEKEIEIRNALRPGEMVHILSYNRGKNYYVLDRV